MIPVGSLLFSNDYMRANNKRLSGVVLEVRDDLWGKKYSVFLSNGITHWMDEEMIRDLFDVFID
jgi:hypothetical protein